MNTVSSVTLLTFFHSWKKCMADHGIFILGIDSEYKSTWNMMEVLLSIKPKLRKLKNDFERCYLIWKSVKAESNKLKQIEKYCDSITSDGFNYL